MIEKLNTPLTTLSLTTEQKGLGTPQLPKTSLSASIDLTVHPFCCGRAVAHQSLLLSRSSGCTLKCVFRKELFSSQRALWNRSCFLARSVQCPPHQNGRKTIWGVNLTQSTELLEEIFRLCLVIVLTLLFLIKMLKTELCPSLCLQLIKGFA